MGYRYPGMQIYPPVALSFSISRIFQQKKVFHLHALYNRLPYFIASFGQKTFTIEILVFQARKSGLALNII